MNQTANNAIVEVRKMSEQSIKIIGGRLKQFTSQWQYITSDPFILNSVKHYKIEFDNGEPIQFMPPKEITFTLQEQEVIDKEIDKLLIKGVISETTHCPGEYISTIFICPTLEFMKSFYLHLAEGRSASESLNRAMKCLRESEKFSEVKHWAPFVLIGDDITLDLAKGD